jgi:diadenosine tetraphosphate (Ap4A) HIT family hydrolase
VDAGGWRKLVAGEGCPFEPPRAESNENWDLVATLSVSSLYLAGNQTYRGQCLLILDLRHAVRPDQLSAQEWASFCADLHRAERAVVAVVKPDHVNVAALGNVVPHLHWHVIPRTVGDPRWGAPIWTDSLGDMPETRLPARERAELLERLRAELRSP